LRRPKLRGALLCEDLEHERFFRRLLSTRWFGEGKLRVERIPNNQGAGDAWVLERYAREVRYARSKRGESYALVVAIDGDRYKLQERLQQLDQKLSDESLPMRANAEKIAIFVPTRSIETWELWLCGNREVDENGDFKELFKAAEGRGEASARAAAAAWFDTTEQNEIEQRRLPSLTAGRTEIERLDRRK